MQRYVAALKEKKAHLVDLKSHKGKQLTLQTEVNTKKYDFDEFNWEQSQTLWQTCNSRWSWEGLFSSLYIQLKALVEHNQEGLNAMDKRSSWPRLRLNVYAIFLFSFCYIKYFFVLDTHFFISSVFYVSLRMLKILDILVFLMLMLCLSIFCAH